MVQIEGITLVLSAQRRPYHDIVDFTRLGLQPSSYKIIVVKSGYLSPEFTPGESEFDGSLRRGDQSGYRSFTEEQVSQTVLSFCRRPHFSTKGDYFSARASIVPAGYKISTHCSESAQ